MPSDVGFWDVDIWASGVGCGPLTSSWAPVSRALRIKILVSGILIPGAFNRGLEYPEELWAPSSAVANPTDPGRDPDRTMVPVCGVMGYSWGQNSPLTTSRHNISNWVVVFGVVGFGFGVVASKSKIRKIFFFQF